MGAVNFVIGIDIGQKRDPTAIAVSEEIYDYNATEPRYEVRYLGRLPLGTPYPQVATRLAEIVRNTRIHGEDAYFRRVGTVQGASVGIETYVDATGVGQPVVDLLSQVGVDVNACYFTHGDRRTTEGGRITIGKAWLVSRLQALLQTGRVKIPSQLADSDALVRELLDYEIKVDQNANDKYGAFKVGSHDDLVTAVGLSVQGSTQPWIREPTGAFAEYMARQ